MKTRVISMLLLFSLGGWWQWQRASREKLTYRWRNARFLNPEVTSEIIEQRLNIRTHRPTDFITDVKQAAQAEFHLWEAQFEKGAEDRHQRLLWQQQSETTIKTEIKEHLLDEAWLEQQLQKAAPPVTDADARAWFSQHAESLRIPAMHHVSHLFLTRHDPKKPDRSTEIRALHQRLMRGEPWAELTSQHSEDERNRHREGDLGWLSRERMPTDFMTAVERQPAGLNFTANSDPNAEAVYALGDWNGWGDGTALQPQGSSGIWAGICAEAREGHCYKYAVVAKGGHTTVKADPMARQSEVPPSNASRPD